MCYVSVSKLFAADVGPRRHSEAGDVRVPPAHEALRNSAYVGELRLRREFSQDLRHGLLVRDSAENPARSEEERHRVLVNAWIRCRTGIFNHKGFVAQIESPAHVAVDAAVGRHADENKVLGCTLRQR